MKNVDEDQQGLQLDSFVASTTHLDHAIRYPLSKTTQGRSSELDSVQAVAWNTVQRKMVTLANDGATVSVYDSTFDELVLEATFRLLPSSSTASKPKKLKVVEIAYVHDTMAVLANGCLSIWNLAEECADWTHLVSSSAPNAVSIKLAPLARILATFEKDSNIVCLRKSHTLDAISQVVHSLPLRSADWRPTPTTTDSGPILFTATVDGMFRLWGCMIDQPDHFSLWATLDVHSDLPRHIPLCTEHIRTTAVAEVETIAGNAKGTEDSFVTVFSDGSVYETMVMNFDCRPPTCLSQSSRLLHSRLFLPSQLANLRHTFILPSSDDPNRCSLIGRCLRGTLLRAELNLGPDAVPPSPPRSIYTLSTGKIQSFATSSSYASVLVCGNEGRIQNWVVEDAGMAESFVSEVGLQEEDKVASWDQGNSLAVISRSDIKVYALRSSGRLSLVSVHKRTFSSLISSFYAVPSGLEGRTITLVALTVEHEISTWMLDPITYTVRFLGSQCLASSFTDDVISYSAFAALQCKEGEAPASIGIVAITALGMLTFWSTMLSISLPDVDSPLCWDRATSVRTGKNGVYLVACSVDSVSAIVSSADGQHELSIWDSKESEFTSGQQFAQSMSTDVFDLKWSVDGAILALAYSNKIDLLCPQRLDDLNERPGWATFASIDVAQLTTSSITKLSWLSNGQLIVAAGDSLIFYSSILSATKQDCHQFALEKSAPLPYHHPQLLFQSLLYGKTAVVIKILAGLAGQLTSSGDLTPIHGYSTSIAKITTTDFLVDDAAPPQASSSQSDVFAALTSAQVGRSKNRLQLSEEDASRLIMALKKFPLSGLSKLEHAHLSLLVQTVFEIQNQQSSLDPNGLRYLISMRSYFIYSTASRSHSLKSVPAQRRIKYRGMLWAFHSDSQDLLLDASARACPGKLDWENAKALCLFMWLRSPTVLAKQMEAVGRCEFMRDDVKDPISASLFYLALRKKHMVVTLWKQAGGHGDQRAMIKLLMNDFEEPRWKTAALKNAYALISRRRFLFAATFFLLAGSLKDAVNVILRQLDDFQLAIAIARAYEGDDGPVIRSILEETVLPLAFKSGFRWLASWTFWMLNRRDLAIQTIVTPLADLASTLPYQLVSIGSPMHEDPSLVLLLAQLRSWSLQTVKGAMAVPGRTEFNFVLHMSRVLCRMGCHVLALDLVCRWEFLHPTLLLSPSSPTFLGETTVTRRPSLQQKGGRHSLRRLSTKIDVTIPSNLPSRTASPGAEFLSVLKDVQKATKAPEEFSFDNFSF